VSTEGATSPPSRDRHPVRVGVIGTGRIGRVHAELLTASVPGAVLAAVSDAVMPLADEVGTALGVPVLETRHLLDNEAIDAVAICAPTDTHVPLLIAAAEAGKAVFCEKPISLDLAEVDRALAEVERTATPLMVGFNRRFDASHAAVHDAVASGALGPPHLARITSRDPGPPPLSYARTSGGIFLDMTIHDFDMARYVVGSEVVEVYAAGAVRVVPELAELGDVDTAVVTLWHENECLTVIDNSRRASYGYDQRVEVLGAQALAASDNPLVNTALTRDANGTRLATLPYFFIERYTASYVRQWEAFVAALGAGEAPPTSGRDGRAALVLGLAAKLSLLERRPVRVAEVDGSPAAPAQI
jgi:myo-inositol 2-dehydrogenase / D-chiro-inositol 1-dehydrogenase